jgi:putative ABC transport system permease protein
MNFWFDLKYALRLLVKSWGHSLLCAVVVALSVGLAVWTYTLVYSQVWKPLPIAGAERWYSVQLSVDGKRTPRPSIDAYTYQELLANNRSADVIGAFAHRTAVLSEGQASKSLRAAAISPRLLAAAGVAPQLGRTFHANEGHDGSAPVAILSYDTWQSYFAGDPNVIGRTARVDAAPVQIVGVMPRDFTLFYDHELWTPLQLPKLARPRDSTVTLSPVIALRDGQNLTAITNAMQTAVSRVNGDYPDVFHAKRAVKIFPAARMDSHPNKPVVSMIAFMAAGVLLLGGVNISMVFLARLLERTRELALRTALGASRPRLLRQCLLETALVVTAGLALGWALAAGGVRWTHSIAAFMSRTLATGRMDDVPTLRPVDLVAALGAAVVVWLLSTLIPALRVARRDAATSLAGSGKGLAIRDSNRSVGLLVGLQVITSCLVLVMAGSLVLAVRQEVGKPNGLRTERVMFSTSPTELDARYALAPQRLRYWENLTAAVQTRIPGAQVAFATSPPTRPARVSAVVETEQGRRREGTLTLPVSVVSESYFDLLGIHLRSGRLFDSTDDASSLDVAVVDEQLAARYWPDQNAIGKRVQIADDWLTVVGVVSGVAGRPYRYDETGVVYRPLRQAVPREFHLLIRTPGAGDPRAAIRAAAFAADRDLPLHNLQTLDDFIAAMNMSMKAMVPVIIVIALITALLAASGLFGLISRSVAQRTQEVGIRRALGATSWRATSRFRRQGLIYLIVSIAGVALGVLVTNQMGAVFPNILDHVFVVTAGVVLLMAAVVFTASYLPTRRAVALEPGDALRYE